MTRYTVRIERQLGRYWWHIAGTAMQGHAATERQARLSVARAVLSLAEHGVTPPVEAWTAADAQYVIDTDKAAA